MSKVMEAVKLLEEEIATYRECYPADGPAQMMADELQEIVDKLRK